MQFLTNEENIAPLKKALEKGRAYLFGNLYCIPCLYHIL